jgi:hypothetical protein
MEAPVSFNAKLAMSAQWSIGWLCGHATDGKVRGKSPEKQGNQNMCVRFGSNKLKTMHTASLCALFLGHLVS